MQLFNKAFTQPVICTVDNHIDAIEVICRLYNVVHIKDPIIPTDGVGFVDEARLVMCESAALNGLEL